MERGGFALPLLIGGATTSRVHTAVKIAPNYLRGQAVYVTDASRAVGVVSTLLNPETRAGYVTKPGGKYQKVAEAPARADDAKARQPLALVRENRLKLDFS